VRGLISAELNPNGCELDEGNVVCCEFAIPSGDAPTLLDPVEEALDQIARVAEVQKSVTNSFARGEVLNQQLYVGCDTREDPDVEIFTHERSHADIPSASSGDSHAELGSRFRQAIQPTTIDSVATISGGTPCPYSPWRVTVASAANITVQPSAEPHGRVPACASRMAVVSSSDPVTKWNQ
jgi:hypothetical protein